MTWRARWRAEKNFNPRLLYNGTFFDLPEGTQKKGEVGWCVFARDDQSADWVASVQGELDESATAMSKEQRGARTLCLHQATLESNVAFREFEPEAHSKGLGFRLGRSDMVPVVVGVFAAVSTSSSRHLDDILREKVRFGFVVREWNSKSRVW